MNANNPYAPPESLATEPQLAEGEWVLSENGILCRGSLTLPAICLVTGRMEDLAPWKLQLANRSPFSRIILLWGSTLLIGTSALFALLELIRLWNEPGVSIPAFGFLWDVIEVRLLWSGTKLKSRETHSGLTEVTGFSGPFRRAIAEYVDAQKSRDITNNCSK